MEGSGRPEQPTGTHQPTGILSGERHDALLRAKLTALVRDLAADSTSTVTPVSVGDRSDEGAPGPQVRGSLTGLMQPEGPGYVLVELGTPQAVAGAVSWAVTQRCDSLTIFVDLDGGAAARYASYFSATPTIGGHALDVRVRSVAGASSVEVLAEPVPSTIDTPDAPDELLAVMRSQGLEIVSEHGVIRGEVLGLEVARLVRWPVETGGDGELHLEVGVGRFDRDAVWAVRDGMNMADALADTVAMVREYRRAGAPPHPLGRLRRERWLRTTVISDPSLVGAAVLEPVGMTVEAPGLKDVHPSGAFGRDDHGDPVVVVTSTGVDLAVMPLAADLRTSIDRAARLVVAVPPSDVHPVLGRLASMLSPTAEIVPVPAQW